MTSIAADLSSLAQQIATSQTTFEALQGSQYVTEEEQSEVFWGMRRWPNKLTEVGPCEKFAPEISACKRAITPWMRMLETLHICQSSNCYGLPATAQCRLHCTPGDKVACHNSLPGQ